MSLVVVECDQHFLLLWAWESRLCKKLLLENVRHLNLAQGISFWILSIFLASRRVNQRYYIVQRVGALKTRYSLLQKNLLKIYRHLQVWIFLSFKMKIFFCVPWKIVYSYKLGYLFLLNWMSLRKLALHFSHYHQ